jgi:hypothetical protein
MTKNEPQPPTIEVEAELLRTNGQTLEGHLHLPAASPSHDGPPRADEWLNETGLFFLFQPEGSERPSLLNKADVLVLSVPAAANGPGGLEAARLPEQAVVAECDEKTLRGTVAIDLPDGEHRLLEHVNRPGPFLTLRGGERHHLVQKQRITKLIEVQEESRRRGPRRARPRAAHRSA